MSGRVVDFSVAMRPTSARMQMRRKVLDIRLAPALPPNIGRWEWAVVEESRDAAGIVLERELLANGLEDLPEAGAMRAAQAMADILRDRNAKGA
jgi:hypothetical protein